MITTTLSRIKNSVFFYGSGSYSLPERWKVRLKRFKENKPIPFSVLVDIFGIEVAIGCCQAEPQYSLEWRMFAIWCVKRIRYLISDYDVLKSLDVIVKEAERYALGEIAFDRLKEAWDSEKSYLKSIKTMIDPGLIREDAEKAVIRASIFSRGIIIHELIGDSDGTPKWHEKFAEITEIEKAAQTKEFLRIVTETEVKEP